MDNCYCWWLSIVIQKEAEKPIALDINLAKIFEFDQVLGLAFLHLDKPLKLLHEIK